MKVLGVWLDTHLALDDQFRSLLRKTKVRQGLLARVASSVWGLGTTVRKVTHDALLTSLLRYELIVMGSCLPDDLIDKVDTLVVNTAARRAVGLIRITGIEALRFLAGTHSARNLFILQCAQALHATLMCDNRGARDRLRVEVCVALRRGSLDATVMPFR